MVGKFLITASFFILLAPLAAHAEELLPAICQQVLEPDKESSVTGIIADYVAEKAKEVPKAIITGTKSLGDDAAELLADNLESYKKTVEPTVLGTSTDKASKLNLVDSTYNRSIDAIKFLLQHWLWTISGLGLAVLAWFLRF